jgi:hypothetical protein
VATSNSLQYYDYGRADEKEAKDEKPPKRGGRTRRRSRRRRRRPRMEAPRREGQETGRRRPAYAATEIRSNFADTMVWSTVTTDAAGPRGRRGRHPGQPDHVAATARAVTADSRFGQQVGSVVSRKEMIVRLETPRFFTQNDETVISAIVHNYLEGEKEVKIELAVEASTSRARRRCWSRSPRGQKRIDWKSKIRRRPGEDHREGALRPRLRRDAARDPGARPRRDEVGFARGRRRRQGDREDRHPRRAR